MTAARVITTTRPPEPRGCKIVHDTEFQRFLQLRRERQGEQGK